MAIALVQTTSNTATSTSVVLTLPSKSVAGDMICVFAQYASANTMTISDSAGNVYTQPNTTLNASPTAATGVYKLDVWYCLTPSPATTITISNSGSSSGALVAWAGEYSGVSAFGSSVVSYSATATTTPAALSLTYSTTDLVLGGIAYAGTSVSATPASPFIEQFTQTYSSQDLGIATVIGNPTTGSGPAFTLGNASAYGQLALNFTAVASTVYTNNAEGGTNGTTVTTGNTGGVSGTAFGSVVPGTGGTITFTNSLVNTGALSYAFVPAAATACSVGYSFSTTSLIYTSRAYAYFTSITTAAVQFMRFYSSSALITNIALGNGSIQNLIVQTAAGTAYTGSVNFPLNTWLRFELATSVGTTTSNGYIYAAVYSGNSATPLDSYVSYTANTGTAVGVTFGIGKLTSTGNWNPFYIDDIVVNYASSNMVGPTSVSNVTGTATVTSLTSITI